MSDITGFAKMKPNHYPLHPGAEHPPTMCMEIPIEEYESIKRENAELKDEIKRLENVRKVHIESIESMCEGLKLNAKQICKTQRALWLARAERAKETQFLWQVYCHCDKLYFCKPFCVSTRKNPYRYISHMNVVEWDEFWGKIKNKCLAKAEEYK